MYIIKVPENYIPIIEDVVRMVLIQITIQLLTSFGENIQFFSSEFILLIIYIILGVCLYWLVFKNLIKFSSDSK